MTDFSARLTLARNLRITRLLRNLSQEAMADLVGMDRSYYGGIERAERNVGLDRLEDIALALVVTIPDLFTEPDANQVASQILEAVNKAVDGAPFKIREEPAIYAVA